MNYNIGDIVLLSLLHPQTGVEADVPSLILHYDNYYYLFLVPINYAHFNWCDRFNFFQYRKDFILNYPRYFQFQFGNFRGGEHRIRGPLLNCSLFGDFHARFSKH